MKKIMIEEVIKYLRKIHGPKEIFQFPNIKIVWSNSYTVQEINSNQIEVYKDSFTGNIDWNQTSFIATHSLRAMQIRNEEGDDKIYYSYLSNYQDIFNIIFNSKGL